MIFVSEEELNRMMQQLTKAERLAQYLTLSDSLWKEERKRLKQKLNEFLISAKLS